MFKAPSPRDAVRHPMGPLDRDRRKRLSAAVWLIRCLIAWSFRVIAVLMSFVSTVLLLRGCLRDEAACAELFPLGVAEVFMVGFGAFMIAELAGRLLSWTDPKGPLPRFDDRR